MVVKGDGTRQLFDRGKLLNGVIRACVKRPVSIEEVEKLSLDIESQIQNSLQKEVSTNEIGEMILSRLKTVDEVAYVRFASAYKKFKDINSFMEELQKLIDER
jgi:transcriptional repressor NrdR